MEGPHLETAPGAAGLAASRQRAVRKRGATAGVGPRLRIAGGECRLCRSRKPGRSWPAERRRRRKMRPRTRMGREGRLLGRTKGRLAVRLCARKNAPDRSARFPPRAAASGTDGHQEMRRPSCVGPSEASALAGERPPPGGGERGHRGPCCRKQGGPSAQRSAPQGRCPNGGGRRRAPEGGPRRPRPWRYPPPSRKREASSRRPPPSRHAVSPHRRALPLCMVARRRRGR